MKKRFFDLGIAIVGLLVLWPVIAVVAWQVWRKLGSPVFFVQERPGLNGEAFKLVKFRTMKVERETGGSMLGDRDRLTEYGQFLRETSLDELPELWNVLRGDMSLVGPRPLLMEYLPRYTPEQARRHEVKPGLTGWAQVNGRNNLPWQERLALDVWYVDNQSFRLDLKIVFLTVWKVLRREGIAQEGHATMEPFHGDGAGRDGT